MSDKFVFVPAGEEVVLSHLNRAIAALEKPRALYQAIGAQLEENVNDRITRTKQDPNGKPWPEISELTPGLFESFTGEKWPGGSLLRRTQRMLESLAPPRATDDGVSVGFSVPYAIYHETGTERDGKPYMPRRGLLLGDPSAGTLGAEDREDVQLIIDDYLSKALGV